MLAEAIHSTVDTGDSVLLFVGVQVEREAAGPYSSFWARQGPVFLAVDRGDDDFLGRGRSDGLRGIAADPSSEAR